MFRRRRSKREPIAPHAPSAPKPDRDALLESDDIPAVVVESRCELYWEDDPVAGLVIAGFHSGNATAQIDLGDGARLDGDETAAERLVAVAQEHAGALELGIPPRPAAPGEVVITLLTVDGARWAAASEEDLGAGVHELSPVFHAAHRVLGELRGTRAESPPPEDPEDPLFALWSVPLWSEDVLDDVDDADELFAGLGDRGIRRAILRFSGGNDEGGVDEVVVVRADDSTTVVADTWNDPGPLGDRDFAEALEAPMHKIVPFVGSFAVNGTLTWDVERRAVLLRQAIALDGMEFWG